MSHMKGHEASITFHRKTWHGLASSSCYEHLKRPTKKLIFCFMKLEYFVCHIIRAITLKHFHMVMHSYTASFSIRTHFYKTNKIFYLKN